jgi:hypothetical protein
MQTSMASFPPYHDCLDRPRCPISIEQFLVNDPWRRFTVDDKTFFSRHWTEVQRISWIQSLIQFFNGFCIAPWIEEFHCNGIDALEISQAFHVPHDVIQLIAEAKHQQFTDLLVIQEGEKTRQPIK